MIGFCPLASGSKGNCIYVGSKETRILIDAGLTLGATAKKLAEISVDVASIQAILITHEHTDHIKGLEQFSKEFSIPIITNALTAQGILSALECKLRFKLFTTGEAFQFNDLEIMPFSIPHDTLDPVAFTIKAVGLKLGFCTDLGHATSLVRKMLEGCDYLYLEANHQPSMVYASARPPIYKQRVLGKQGHLSNEACAELLASIAHSGLKHVHLAHLSSECNAPELALKIVREAIAAKNFTIPLTIAYQEQVSLPIDFST
jgi:phosphoribosyl 1,2-cyclic phosphodiesterase